MSQPSIEAVRRFNRTVTRRLGTLDDSFMGSGRPLGEARLLWEIGRAKTDVRSLRRRLGLDSGYVSRVLRSLETDGLVETGPAPGDARVRRVSVTARGRAECEALDKRSDERAAALLAPLGPDQQERLVEAMTTVEWLLQAAAIEISPADPATPEARHCIAAYFAELDERFERGFDPGASISAGDSELVPPQGVLLVASIDGRPIGCGALKLHAGAPAELKRMWVDPSARGLGLGRRLLHELEHYARTRGVATVRLETNRSLLEAISLYRSAGYREVPAFNDEPHAHHWFEKDLA